MALIYRLRNLHLAGIHRRFSSSASSLSLDDSSTPSLTPNMKRRTTISLLQSEQNPDRIVDICRSAALTADSDLERLAFTISIEKLAKDNHFSTIHNFLEELRTTRDDLKTERFVSHSIVLYGQANMIEHAIATFKELHEGKEIKGSIKSLNALLFACNLAKDYKRVRDLFVEFTRMYDLKPDIYTYGTVIKAYCLSGDSSLCYSVLEEMVGKGIVPNAAMFSTLLSGFYREEKLEDVDKVLDLMKNKYGIDTEVGIYNVRIQSLCKLNRSVDAKSLFEEMPSKGTEPNSDSFELLIRGFCKEGNLEEAKNLFKRMGESKCEPDTNCYFTMVYFLCEGGDYETALSVCKQSMAKGWVPRFRTMKLLVEGLATINKVEEAKQIIQQIKKKYKTGANLWTEIEASLS